MKTGALKRYLGMAAVALMSLALGFFAAYAPDSARAQTEQQQKSANIDDLRFEDHLWNRSLLGILDEGSAIIAKDTVFDVAPYPANSSAETQAELDYLDLLAREARAPEVLQKIYSEDHSTVWNIFIDAGYIVPQHNIKLMPLLEMADQDMRYFTMKYKVEILRARPVVMAQAYGRTLETAVETPGHSAYPSGHAGQTWLVGLLLSYVDPSHSEDYMKFAKSVGFRREIAGLHYPSDSVAGRKLAEQVYVKLMENTAFKTKMDDARDAFVRADLSKAYVVTEFDNPDHRYVKPEAEQ